MFRVRIGEMVHTRYGPRTVMPASTTIMDIKNLALGVRIMERISDHIITRGATPGELAEKIDEYLASVIPTICHAAMHPPAATLDEEIAAQANAGTLTASMREPNVQGDGSPDTNTQPTR